MSRAAFRAVKESPDVTARSFGQEAITMVRLGAHITARHYATIAAHFARRYLAQKGGAQ